VGLARIRQNTARARRALTPGREDWWSARLDLVRRYAPGRSFADIGTMWGIHGKVAFLAEECGATSVSAVDAMEPTPEFEAEHARRDSKVRYVHADLHDEPWVMEQVGRHDVVWCTGVIYHTPDPFGQIEVLRRITGSILVLGTHTIPEIPGIEQGCVFYPGLGAASRTAYASPHRNQDLIALGTEFDERPEHKYDNYWWGMSPSAVRAMVTNAGFEVIHSSKPNAFFLTLVARPVSTDGR
jgi:hypothetical protein